MCAKICYDLKWAKYNFKHLFPRWEILSTYVCILKTFLGDAKPNSDKLYMQY